MIAERSVPAICWARGSPFLASLPRVPGAGVPGANCLGSTVMSTIRKWLTIPIHGPSVTILVRITKVETIAVRTPMREPLVWPGGTRESASGLLVQIHTDEGIVGIGEAPGPTLPTIQTIIDQELTQFLVGQDPLRVEWLVHRMEEFARNWSSIGNYAISGIEIALLDLKGKALGISGDGAPRRLLPRPRGRRRLPLHRRAGGRGAQGRRVRRRRLHGAEAEGRPQLRAGSRHARCDPRPRRAPT